MSHPLIRLSLVSAAGLLCLAATACSFTIPSVTTGPTAPVQVSTTAPAETTAPPEDDLTAALAEREQFFADQQFVIGTVPSAQTEAQKELIAQQRAYIESQGGTWTSESEGVTLALAADACETSILNFHRVDVQRFEVHIASSPLFSLLLGDAEGAQRRAAERNIASVMVFGTSFLCPADAPQWEAAFTEYYG